ncbi:MAG: hypothetical protein ACFN0Y_01235 [Lactobacillus sp.]|jgi:hypothetical protein
MAENKPNLSPSDAMIDNLISASLALTNATALISDQVTRLSKQAQVPTPDEENIMKAFEMNHQFQQQLINLWNREHPDASYNIQFGEEDD